MTVSVALLSVIDVVVPVGLATDPYTVEPLALVISTRDVEEAEERATTTEVITSVPLSV